MTALALGTTVPAKSSIVVDGRLDPAEGYQLGYTVAFRVESGAVIPGGQIWFGTDGTSGDHFLYFAMPKGFVDNTYGANAIGWGDRGHSFKDLLNSDSLGMGDPFVLKTLQGDVALTVDYLALLAAEEAGGGKKKKKGPGGPGGGDAVPSALDYLSGGIGDAGLQRNEGEVISGNASGVLEIATSQEWNVDQYASAADLLNGAGVILNSPSANADYTGVAAGFEDWIFEVGYEFRFDADLFGPGFIDPALALGMIELGEAHVSPSKVGKFVGYEDPECVFGCTPPPPPPIPEPATWAMMIGGFGLTGGAMRWRRKVSLATG